jgi:HAD superfamily hydrolase (TIGR01549 family)
MDCNDYKVLIFDCDGVLIDSNELKLKAAASILSDYDATVVEAFVAHFRKSFGRSRYVLFREFIEEFLGQPFNQTLYDDLVASYGRQCAELYQNAPVIEGAKAFLEKHHGKHLYVASGGLEDELRSVLSSHGMMDYFDQVYGSPPSKKENVARIVRQHSGARALMLGDAHTDFEAAHASGVDFLFCSKYTTDEVTMKQLQNKYGFPSVETLERLLG